MDSDDWGLGALVRSCGGLVPVPSPEADQPSPPPPVASPREAIGRVHAPPACSSSLYDVLEYLDLEHERLLPRSPFSITPSSSGRDDVLISFPATTLTPGPARKQAGRKPGGRAPRRQKRSKSKKSQVKKVVREVPVGDGGVSGGPDDQWAWRKYGQKPIKGSPHPRGYYKCSSLKACNARKLVERSPAKPGVLIVTYIADHCHAVPTYINALPPGAARSTPHSPPMSDDAVSRRQDDNDSADVSSSVAGADGESELWAPADMDMDLDDIFAAFDDDFDNFFDVGNDGIFGRSVSL